MSSGDSWGRCVISKTGEFSKNVSNVTGYEEEKIRPSTKLLRIDRKTTKISSVCVQDILVKIKRKEKEEKEMISCVSKKQCLEESWR